MNLNDMAHPAGVGRSVGWLDGDGFGNGATFGCNLYRRNRVWQQSIQSRGPTALGIEYVSAVFGPIFRKESLLLTPSRTGLAYVDR